MKQTIRAMIVAAVLTVGLLIGAGQASAVTSADCESAGGIAVFQMDATWWCVGGFYDGQQILDQDPNSGHGYLE